MKVLWLASWYPNPLSPYEGDFIQRHAKAVSSFVPVNVFYVNQSGIIRNIKEDSLTGQKPGQLSEKILFFRFKKTGIKLIDKLVFNIRYYNVYKKNIKGYILKEGRPDIIHIHVPMKAGMIGRWIKKRWGIPYIVSEQSAHYDKTSNDSFFSKNFFHRYSVKKIFQEASLVTNVSGIVGKTLLSLFDLPAVQTIHNTVDTRYFNYKELPVSKFRFFHASTLTEHHKNIEGILRAASGLIKQRQDFELVIAGPDSAGLRQRIGDMDLGHFVTLIGEVTYPEVASQMQKASAFLLFSRYENFPCVVVESLCCGLPVIASDVGGIREAVDGTNGILVQSENEDELMLAMNKMLDDYEKFNRKEIAQKAQSLYSYEVIGKKFYDLYASIKTKE